MTPNDIHINEWVYANANGNMIPVKITAVNNGQVVAINHVAEICDSFNFDKLSPIPLTGETIKLFAWDGSKKLSVQINRETEKVFVRYIGERNEIKKYYKLNSIHELQQFYYRLFKTPLCLALC